MEAMQDVARRVEQARQVMRDPSYDERSPFLRSAALGELIRRQEHLADLHRQIDASRGKDVEYLWQKFFLQYDDFIEAMQDAGPRALDATAASTPSSARAR
ncbi:hypothetical protein [Cognatilysobacter lacus]|uniref:Uncharacterized protein n=1 Tax=Cognatilysobacter lacus TaxID=1643323 RepID=A0A5D8Z5J8_9GAMM|nr:hypothetical protein [Lysobacter lacus]TZF90019.1 hypothetical protein FW784_07060 [Lysobacter lacus]